MYQCLDCDKQFDKPGFYIEYHNGIKEPGEKIDCCPFCKGNYEEISKCKECGEYFFSDELFDKTWCKSCLIEKINCDTFLEYLSSEKIADNSSGKLEDFMFRMFFEVDDVPIQSSAKLKRELKRIYERETFCETIWKPKDFKKSIIRYFDNYEFEDFAEWLNGTNGTKSNI